MATQTTLVWNAQLSFICFHLCRGLCLCVCCCRKRFSVAFTKFPCTANSPTTTAHVFLNDFISFAVNLTLSPFTTYFCGDTKTFLRLHKSSKTTSCENCLFKPAAAFHCSLCSRNEITSSLCLPSHLLLEETPSRWPSREGPAPAGEWVEVGRLAERARPAPLWQAGPASAEPGHSHGCHRHSTDEGGFAGLEPPLQWGCCGLEAVFPGRPSTLTGSRDCTKGGDKGFLTEQVNVSKINSLTNKKCCLVEDHMFYSEIFNSDHFGFAFGLKFLELLKFFFEVLTLSPLPPRSSCPYWSS